MKKNDEWPVALSIRVGKQGAYAVMNNDSRFALQLRVPGKSEEDACKRIIQAFEIVVKMFGEIDA